MLQEIGVPALKLCLPPEQTCQEGSPGTPWPQRAARELVAPEAGTNRCLGVTQVWLRNLASLASITQLCLPNSSKILKPSTEGSQVSHPGASSQHRAPQHAACPGGHGSAGPLQPILPLVPTCSPAWRKSPRWDRQTSRQPERDKGGKTEPPSRPGL